MLHGVHHTYSAVLNKQDDIRRNATENSNMVSHGDNVGCVLEHAIFICAKLFEIQWWIGQSCLG